MSSPPSEVCGTTAEFYFELKNPEFFIFFLPDLCWCREGERSLHQGDKWQKTRAGAS